MSHTGKIIKSIAGFYEVYSSGTIYRCRARGVFRALQVKPLVGDNVEFDITDTVSVPKEGSITALLPRQNDLIRPNVANVDQALLLFAVTNPAPSFNMLDRFLIAMDRRGMPAILCFNKLDLALPEQVEELRGVYGGCGCRVLFISAREEDSFRALQALLSGKTTVLAGPSGAGKSTLINRLCPNANMETGELSHRIERGKNTTRHVELLYAGPSASADSGASDDAEAGLSVPAAAEDSAAEESAGTFLVDTPGFTSLDLLDVTARDLKDYYPEFEPYFGKCRYQGCAHLSEPGCAVKKAVKEGKISRIRYANYTEIYADLKDRKPTYS